ncbi:hypothetical protein BJ508DRAFT_314536 [Ascobolus immersus RN42]|uniref:Uncharacterized protein n=1 Tax=Ascobolus immersus RN42 TaxID=1160509 RepID=A0A3N4HGJ7_ASCIM|nr:hypothetical protein BJ508DRAFT_314536 [Ascobolus immersus RN42]
MSGACGNCDPCPKKRNEATPNPDAEIPLEQRDRQPTPQPGMTMPAPATQPVPQQASYDASAGPSIASTAGSSNGSSDGRPPGPAEPSAETGSIRSHYSMPSQSPPSTQDGVSPRTTSQNVGGPHSGPSSGH